MKWMNTPTKLLGIYVSYDERGNNQMNFNLKVQKLQTNLDIWKSRGLTLYGKVLIIKCDVYNIRPLRDGNDHAQ